MIAKTTIRVLAMAVCIVGGCLLMNAQNAREIAPRVFINPGHGGHDSNDRPSPFLNVGVGDTVPYYESDSNILKGNALMRILSKKGYEVATTRINNTSADDLDLFEIMWLAANSGADMFFAIHSNATGTSRKTNFPLALYRGYTGTPAVAGSDTISALIMKHLQGNKATSWVRETPVLAGDWTFYDWGPKVGLGVLRYNKLPGLLSEGSFHDYIPERCRLLNHEYCWLEAWNQSLGIDEWFGKEKDYGLGVVAGRVLNEKALRSDSEQLFGDDMYRPMNHVRLTLISEASGKKREYYTDYLENGVFLFKDIEPGEYILIAEKASAELSRTALHVEANKVTYSNVKVQLAEGM